MLLQYIHFSHQHCVSNYFLLLGGFLHFSCPHGVVYYLNFLFWTESAQDHVDGLLSFETFPTCYISDVSGQVARHMNNRTKQLYFQPNEGRLAPPTEDNISKAIQKALVLEMPWVKNIASLLQQNLKPHVFPLLLTNLASLSHANAPTLSFHMHIGT